MNRKNTPEKFWSLVGKGERNACWLWSRPAMANGYGQFVYQGRGQYVHRLAWVLTHGAIPERLFVCHTCDTPLCCNPEHMFLGSPMANVHDALKKGRMNNRGEANGQARLIPDVPNRMRALYATGLISHRELALAFEVSREHVRDICGRKRWKHLQ